MSKKRKASRKREAGYASQTKLAERLGVSQYAVSKWTARPDWPAKVRKSGPWTEADAQALEQWRATHLEPDRAEQGKRSAGGAGPADADAAPERKRKGGRPRIVAESDLSPERRAKLELLRTRQALLELERKQKARELMPRVEVERANVAKVLAVKTGLMQLARRVESLVPADVAATVEDEIGRLLDAFAGSGD